MLVLLQSLGATTVWMVRTLGMKTIAKRFPDISKSTIKYIKNSKIFTSKKKVSDHLKPKKKKLDTTKKVDTTKKPDTTKKHTVKYKKKKATVPAKKGTVVTTATNLGKEVKNLANIVNKLTLGVVPATGKQFVKAPLKTTAIGAGTTWGAGKAIDIGKNLFKGRAVTDTGNGQDITSEVTGNGAETPIVAPTTGGGNIADFISAHNSAMDSGQEWFKFNGQAYRVGSTRMADF